MDQTLQVFTYPLSLSLSYTHIHTHTLIYAHDVHTCTCIASLQSGGGGALSTQTAPHYQQLHSLQPQPRFHPTPGTPAG